MFKIRSRIFRKTIPIQFVTSKIATNYLIKMSLVSNRRSFMQYPGEEPLTYLITKGDLTPQNFSVKSERVFRTIKLAAEASISFIQVREKDLSAKLVLELVSKAVSITADYKTKILVNDRIDIAIGAKADGVHLTSKSLPAKIIRNISPDNFTIGVSTHSLRAAKKARNEGADFVTFSPIFKTGSKLKYGAPQGVDELRRVCDELRPFSVIALGGIDEDSYKPVIEAGASGFAAIRFLNDHNNLRRIGSGWFENGK